MKRFYECAVAASIPKGGYTINLDGKPIKTPSKRTLIVPTRSLADVIATEWGKQGDTVQFRTLPLTKLANSAVDYVMTQRKSVICELVACGQIDLLCYRSPDSEELLARQEKSWQPLLDWAESCLGVALIITNGVVPIRQGNEQIARLREVLSEQKPFFLSGLLSATFATQSVVIALALGKSHITPFEAWSVGMLDEIYQTELWGDDLEKSKRLAELRFEIEAAGRFMEMSIG